MCTVSFEFWDFCAHRRIWPFVQRVPTDDNVADFPTRSELLDALINKFEDRLRLVDIPHEVKTRVETFLRGKVQYPQVEGVAEITASHWEEKFYFDIGEVR